MKINNDVSFGSAAAVKFPKSYMLNGLQEWDAREFVTNIKKILPEKDAISILHPKDSTLCLVVNNQDKMLLETLLDDWRRAIMLNAWQEPSGAMDAALKPDKGIIAFVRKAFNKIFRKHVPELTESEKTALAATDKFVNAFNNVMLHSSTPKLKYII